jgi:DNA-binding CsgD family transcriptional regulator/tetratricopeptide (TPR) repeat protein
VVAFVGREAELTTASSLLDRLDADRAGALLVSGQPGIGKTRLLSQVEELARQRGFLTAHTVCLPLTTALPFDPVLGLLRGVRRALPGGMAWPETGTPATDLFPWAVRCIEDATAYGRLVLFIDDLQWSDQASLELIYYCVVRLADLPVGWVLATRPASTMRGVLADLARFDWFERLELRGLSRPEVAQLIAASRDVPAGDELVDAVHARSAGNPFFCAELLTAYRQAGTGLSSPIGDVAAMLPATVTDSIARRFAALSAPEQALVAWTAAVPEPAATELLAELASGGHRPPGAAAEIGGQLERLAEAGFLTAAGNGRWRFQHVIVRDAVYQLIPPLERPGIHSAIADTLPADAAAERAPQLAAAERFDEAAAAYVELGEAALARGRGDDAGALFSRARQLGALDSAVAWRAQGGEVLALIRTARISEARELAAALFRRLETATDSLRLMLLTRYALALVDSSELDAACTAADQLAALDPGTDHEVAAEAGLTRAFVLTMAGDATAALPLAEDAVRAAHASGNGILELRARNRLGLVAGLTRGTSAGRELLAPIALAAEDQGLAVEAGLAWLNLSFFADLDGDGAAMEDAAIRGLQVHHLPPVTEVLLRGNAGVGRMLCGDLDGALTHLLAAVRTAAPLGVATRDRVAVSLAHVHIRRGELAAAHRLLDQLQPAVPGSFEHRRALEPRAMLLEEEGDLIAAQAAYREAGRDDNQPGAECLAGQVRVAVAAGQLKAATACLPRLEAMAERWPAAVWLLEQSRGWLAVGRGRPAEAIERFHRASQGGEAFEAARCELEAARLAGDSQTALAVAARLHSMGARRAADRARAVARSLGARPGRPHVHRGPLSEREFEVALQVAAGQTNADIAAALFLSPRTVERHIGNILGKLGFRSRVEIAAHVAAGNLAGMH